jgi:hypothetical protein
MPVAKKGLPAGADMADEDLDITLAALEAYEVGAQYATALAAPKSDEKKAHSRKAAAAKRLVVLAQNDKDARSARQAPASTD